eukprot:7796832-Lingulodinium_polyedra.AAC.1
MSPRAESSPPGSKQRSILPGSMGYDKCVVNKHTPNMYVIIHTYSVYTIAICNRIHGHIIDFLFFGVCLCTYSDMSLHALPLGCTMALATL